MQQISKLTNSISEIVNAVEGKWEYSTKAKSRWAVVGKVVFCEDAWSRDNFPHKVMSWHHSDGGYWGILE